MFREMIGWDGANIMDLFRAGKLLHVLAPPLLRMYYQVYLEYMVGSEPQHDGTPFHRQSRLDLRRR